MGVETIGEWDVLPDKGDKEHSGLVLRETTTVKCNVLLMPYIRATMGKSHDELHKDFVERLLEEQGKHI